MVMNPPAMQEMWPEKWLRCFACPSLCFVVCRGHTQYPAFAPNTLFAPGFSKVAVGFFGFFVSFGSRNCPNCV